MTPTAVIGSYTSAITIDGSTHFLLIQPGGASTAYKKINRNVFLGITGQPMDISTSQNVTNKSLDNTNTITLKDTLFTLQDDGDMTKQARFQLSGITTATIRTYTLPNASSTLADISTTQTLTNKTLTSPIITNGSITGATITTDAIVGQSSATNGTAYGMSITSGKISGTSITAGTIGSTALATNAVQGNQLATNAIKLGSARITTGFSGTSTTYANITGLSVVAVVPSGGRDVEITFNGSSSSSGSAGNNFTIDIFDSTTSTEVGGSGPLSIPVASYAVNSSFTITIPAPSAGSHTYVARYIQSAAGTFFLNASTTIPATMTVKMI